MSRTAIQGDYQVLKFDLGEETYCVDIEHVNEIVDVADRKLTPLPNQPAHVEGVVDLRGRTTTVVNPKTALGLGGTVEGGRIVVFESDSVLASEASQGSSDERSGSGGGDTVGWLVDEAHQVSDVADDDVDRSVAGDGVLGVVREEGGFVVWVDPEQVHG